MKAPADYFALLDAYHEHYAVFSQLPVEHKEEAEKQLFAFASQLLQRDAATKESFEKIAVFHADKFYRLVNQLDILDGNSFLFLRAVGAAFDGISKARGVSIAYLVDNQVPTDRLMGLRAAFGALGFMTASPELFVAPLLEHTPGATGEQVFLEAAMLATRIADEAIAQRKHFIWISGGLELWQLQTIADRIANAPFVGVFRNDVPEDGTKVQVFRAGGKSAPLTPQG